MRGKGLQTREQDADKQQENCEMRAAPNESQQQVHKALLRWSGPQPRPEEKASRAVKPSPWPRRGGQQRGAHACKQHCTNLGRVPRTRSHRWPSWVQLLPDDACSSPVQHFSGWGSSTPSARAYLASRSLGDGIHSTRGAAAAAVLLFLPPPSSRGPLPSAALRPSAGNHGERTSAQPQ